MRNGDHLTDPLTLGEFARIRHRAMQIVIGIAIGDFIVTAMAVVFPMIAINQTNHNAKIQRQDQYATCVKDNTDGERNKTFAEGELALFRQSYAQTEKLLPQLATEAVKKAELAYDHKQIELYTHWSDYTPTDCAKYYGPAPASVSSP